MKKRILTLLIFTILLVVFVPDFVDAQCAEHELSGYAWSGTIGWISFSCQNYTALGAGIDYGVDIDEGNDRLGGYAWSENIGWISFNVGDLGGCPSGTCEAGMDFGGDGSLSGWARALAAGGGWDGWISLSGAGYQVTLNSVLDPAEFENYAWGSDVVGWISFNGSNEPGGADYAVRTGFVPIEDPEDPPEDPENPTGLNVTSGNYCFSTSPPIFLNWTFSGQVSYQIEIDDNSGFSSPITDSGGSSQTYAPGVGALSFNDTYWWRIDVSDGASSSGWVDGPNFSTDPRWPQPSFTWEQDPLSHDIFFDGSAGYCGGCSYSWDFGDGVGISNLEDPIYDYGGEGDFNTTLTATSAGRSCNYSEIVNVDAALPLPTWEETALF